MRPRWLLLGLVLGACGGLQGWQLLLAARPVSAVRRLLAAGVGWLPLGPRLRSLAAVLQGLHVCSSSASRRRLSCARALQVTREAAGRAAGRLQPLVRDQRSAGIMQADEHCPASDARACQALPAPAAGARQQLLQLQRLSHPVWAAELCAGLRRLCQGPAAFLACLAAACSDRINDPAAKEEMYRANAHHQACVAGCRAPAVTAQLRWLHSESLQHMTGRAINMAGSCWAQASQLRASFQQEHAQASAADTRRSFRCMLQTEERREPLVAQTGPLQVYLSWRSGLAGRSGASRDSWEPEPDCKAAWVGSSRP